MPAKKPAKNNEKNILTKESNLKWWVLITVMVGTFLGRIDSTIVNLAIPSIIDDFGITVSAAGWIATAYILANAVFVPIWGKLGDTIGRKKVYILGFTGFIIGSILAGFAWNLNSMILFRIIQAIAGSADYPTAMAIIAVTFQSNKERAQALGIWSASFAAAVVFGPLIGGPLIDTFGWRSVFLINIPIGLIGLAMAITFVDESIDERTREANHKFDWWGAITLGIALSSLVLVLDKGMAWGWTSTNAIITYGAMILFTIIFVIIEKNHPSPIVDLKFFAIPVYVGTLVNNFIVFMGMIGAIFVIPVFATVYLGYSATQTGLLFIPLAFAMMLAAPFGGSLVGKVRAHIVITISTLVAAIGIFMLAGLDARSTAWDIMIPLFVLALGLGFGMSQRTNMIASAVPREEIGAASSVLALVRNISGAFGIAIFATILQNATENHVISIAQNTVVHSTSPLVYGQVTALVILKAQIAGYHTVFMVAGVILLIGAITAFFVRVPEEAIDVKVHVE